jgi:hypothetical protein
LLDPSRHAGIGLHTEFSPRNVHWLSSSRERANFILNKGENKMATNNKKPTHTLRCGNIKATIWQNVSEKGPFFATTFSRPFKDQSGAWRNGTRSV